MSRRFAFEPRDDCVCGLRLQAAAARVTRPFAWGEVTFLRCPGCGSWCQSPVVTGASLAEWFDSDDYQGSAGASGAAYVNYLADEENRRVEARGRYVHDLARLLPPRAAVLEVGCATGSLLAVLRDHGHEVRGLDLSRRFAETARSLYGLDVMLGDVMHTDQPAGPFDAVITMGTVGNFRSVEAVFRNFRRRLKPGGTLIFNFPDADSAWVRYVYRGRFWMFTPSVASFMTKRGCLSALAHAGFDAPRVSGDHQRPSLKKLLHHGRMDGLMSLVSALGMENSRLPFPIPVPTVRLVVARARQ